MWKIIILTESAKYSYHTTASRQIQSTLESDGHAVTILDISFCIPDHKYLQKINELQPDVLITLDLAGFQFRTQAGEIALNMLPTKILNLIWGNKPEYAGFLHKKISLSMLFYDVTGMNHHLPAIYLDLLYYKVLGVIPPEASDSTQAREAFAQIWADFTREVLLSEG